MGSREEIELYMGLEDCTKCTGVFMMNCVGLVERKWGRGEELGMVVRGLPSVPIYELC